MLKVAIREQKYDTILTIYQHWLIFFARVGLAFQRVK